MTVDLAAAMVAGVPIAWRRQCAHVPGGRIALVDGVQLAATGIPDGSVNPAIAWRDPVRAPAAVAAIERFRRAYRVPGHGYDLPDGRFPNLERALEDAGWSMLLTRPGMALNLDGWVHRTPADITIVRARTADHLADWRAVQQVVFGLPPDATSYWAPDTGLLDPYVSHFVGYVGDRAVTSSVGYDCGDSVGVFAVATLDDARGNGYGAAVTAVALDEARRRGATTAWLQASDLGRPVYAGMGFVETGEWVVREKKPDDG